MLNMSPNSPRLVRGGIVTMAPDASTVQTVIALQYKPDSLTRSYQIQSTPGGQDGVRVDVLRLRGPAIETIKLETELDATDQLEFPNRYSTAIQFGLPASPGPPGGRIWCTRIGRAIGKGLK